MVSEAADPSPWLNTGVASKSWLQVEGNWVYHKTAYVIETSKKQYRNHMLNYLRMYIDIWVFQKIVVPSNHPFS